MLLHLDDTGIRHHPELLQTGKERPPSTSRRSQGQDSLKETLHTNCTSEAVDHARDSAVRARDAKEAAGVMRRILNQARDVLAPDRNSVHPESTDLGAVDDHEIHSDLNEVSNLMGIGQFADAARAVHTAGVDDESPSIDASIHELGQVSNVIRMRQSADAACAVQTPGVLDESNGTKGTPCIPSSRHVHVKQTDERLKDQIPSANGIERMLHPMSLVHPPILESIGPSSDVLSPPARSAVDRGWFLQFSPGERFEDDGLELPEAIHPRAPHLPAS